MTARLPTVLVLHANKDAREIAVQVLGSFGLNAQACTHGEEAVELALLEKVDAIMFAGAPDMRASLLVQQIRYGGGLAGIVCCFENDDPERDRIDQDSRTRVVQMPFTLKQVLLAVRAVSPACDRAATAARSKGRAAA